VISVIYLLGVATFYLQDEIPFSSNTIMEHWNIRFRQLLWVQYELLLPSLASHLLHDKSLLMSRRNIIFTLFSYLFKSMGTYDRLKTDMSTHH